MRITVTKITDETLMQRACEFTTGKPSGMTLEKIYQCEHSPMRTQIFLVEMIDIPTFVSVHLVRHNVGVTHFVKSNREDRGGNGEEDRNTPINHAMLINAQSLINMARKRLCKKAHNATVAAMERIKQEVHKVDPALADRMEMDCLYRKGCHELKPCGYFASLEGKG